MTSSPELKLIKGYLHQTKETNRVFLSQRPYYYVDCNVYSSIRKIKGIIVILEFRVLNSYDGEYQVWGKLPISKTKTCKNQNLRIYSVFGSSNTGVPSLVQASSDEDGRLRTVHPPMSMWTTDQKLGSDRPPH